MVGSNVLCTGISYGEHTKHSFWYDSRLFMSENNPSNLVTVHSANYVQVPDYEHGFDIHAVSCDSRAIE